MPNQKKIKISKLFQKKYLKSETNSKQIAKVENR